MGVARELAREALEVRFEDIPAEQVHQIKRLLLDSLGCIYGGLHAESVARLRESAPALGGAPGEASVFGQTERSSVLSALLLNGSMLRYLDLNDVQNSEFVQGNGHGHNSEVFPAILAVAEQRGLSGRDVILASWLGYEISTRFTEAIISSGPTLEKRGWNHDLRASFIMPFVLGRLLGLTAEQIEHAVGIALSRGMVLAVVDHPEETASMAKNLRFPLGVHLSVMATTLASHGVTGPTRALEGGSGFIETVLGGDFSVEHLTGSGWQGHALRAGIKRFAACNAESGHLAATLDLVLEHDIKPQDVQAVAIRTTTRGALHTGDPSRRHPTDKETADHSSYYTTAAVIVDRELGPQQYTPAKLADPEIHRLAECVTIVGEERFNALYPSAEVDITLQDGTVLTHYVGAPPGSWQNPLPDADIEAKFRSLSSEALSADAQQRCIDAVWGLDGYDDANDFMRDCCRTD